MCGVSVVCLTHWIWQNVFSTEKFFSIKCDPTKNECTRLPHTTERFPTAPSCERVVSTEQTITKAVHGKAQCPAKQDQTAHIIPTRHFPHFQATHIVSHHQCRVTMPRYHPSNPINPIIPTNPTIPINLINLINSINPINSITPITHTTLPLVPPLVPQQQDPVSYKGRVP